MPMISAAMSMSRIAIQARPAFERTRFLATTARIETMTQREQIAADRALDFDAEAMTMAGSVTMPDAL